MDPNVKNFLIVNGIVVLALVFYFLKRRNNQPTVLKMKKSAGSEVAAVSQSVPEPQEAILNGERPKGRDLNVIFVFNGHPFDAYEALGLPAGSPMPAVKRAYEDSVKKVNADSREFIDKAYESICRKTGSGH